MHLYSLRFIRVESWHSKVEAAISTIFLQLLRYIYTLLSLCVY